MTLPAAARSLVNLKVLAAISTLGLVLGLASTGPVEAASSTPSSPEKDFGPKGLSRLAKSARRNAVKVRQEIVTDASRWADRKAAERPGSIAAFQDSVARWVPGAEDLAPNAGTVVEALHEAEREKLRGYSKTLVESARGLLEAELGGAAGIEAYRALGLDMTNGDAGAQLGYVEVAGVYRHPREAQAKSVADASSSDGGMPHVQRFTFFEVHNDVEAGLADGWGEPLDQVLLWMRARFLHVPRYVEPEWPIEVRVYSTEDAIRAGKDRVPAEGFAHWDGRANRVVVLASTFVPGKTMPMEIVIKHELAHAFLDLGFPAIPDPKTRIDNAVSGWLTEGFEAWIYGASVEHPNDVRFWETTALQGPGTKALLAGDDVLEDLVDKGWVPSRESPLADVAPFLADYCAADEIRWEGFARLTANLHSYNQRIGDFRQQLGSPVDVSRALRKWIEEHDQ